MFITGQLHPFAGYLHISITSRATMVAQHAIYQRRVFLCRKFGRIALQGRTLKLQSARELRKLCTRHGTITVRELRRIDRSTESRKFVAARDKFTRNRVNRRRREFLLTFL